jgi:hypothetical protein
MFTNDSTVGVEQGAPVQRELDLVQGRLVAVKHDQLGRHELVQLAAELRADGAARPGDEDALAREVPRDRRHVGPDRAAAEQVADPRVTDALDPGAPANQLGDCRHHLGGEPAQFRPHRQVADRGPAGPRDRDHQYCGPGGGGHLGHPRPVPPHRNPVHAQPSLVRVVVEERDRPVRRTRLVQQAGDQHCARLAGPEHDDLDPRLRRPLFAPPPHGVQHVTRGGDRRQRDERPPGDGLHRIPLSVDQQAAQQHRRDQHQAAGDGHAEHLVEASPLGRAR